MALKLSYTHVKNQYVFDVTTNRGTKNINIWMPSEMNFNHEGHLSFIHTTTTLHFQWWFFQDLFFKERKCSSCAQEAHTRHITKEMSRVVGVSLCLMTLSCLLGTITALPSKPGSNPLPSTDSRQACFLSSLVLCHRLFVFLSYLTLSCLLGTINAQPS